MTNLIDVKNLSVTYDNFSLKNLNLTIPTDMIIGLIGENGAGKPPLY